MLIVLQLLYAACGAGYNAISALQVRGGRGPLSPMNPAVGLVVMGSYAGLVLLGWTPWSLAYAVGMVASLIVLAGFGFFRHLGNRRAFASSWAWGIALGLNGTGAMLNTAGLYFACQAYFFNGNA